MLQYRNLVQKILNEGEFREDRTGVGSYSIFGEQLKFDLRESFPLVSEKETKYKTAFLEMLWFLRGETNTKFLHEHNVKIWDDWADKDGNLGPIYGYQWRSFPGNLVEIPEDEVIGIVDGVSTLNKEILSFQNFIGVKEQRSSNGNKIRIYQDKIDQLTNLIKDIRTNPKSRRHIVTAWNPAAVPLQGLPPCHWAFQCYVSNDGHLDLLLNMRSMDVFLGTPFNIAQYALLLTLIAQCTRKIPRFLIINCGDSHLYSNHIDLAKEMVTRLPIVEKTKLIVSNYTTDIDSFSIEDFKIENYVCHTFMKAPIAV